MADVKAMMNFGERKPERSFMTRNRRGEAPTTLLDELIDGVPTGKIVESYKVVDGELVVQYAKEPCETAKKLRKDKPVPAIVVGDEHVGVAPMTPPRSYFGVPRSLKDVNIGEAITPLVVKKQDTVTEIKVDADLTVKFILTFDSPNGTDAVEFDTIEQAQAYPQKLKNYFGNGVTFGNFQLFREYRTPREQLNFGE